jgi:hypothetical protein
VTINVRPKEGGGLKISRAAHLRTLEKLVEAYDRVIEAAINLLAVDCDMAPTYADHFEKALHAACQVFYANGDKVRLKRW